MEYEMQNDFNGCIYKFVTNDYFAPKKSTAISLSYGKLPRFIDITCIVIYSTEETQIIIHLQAE